MPRKTERKAAAKKKSPFFSRESSKEVKQMEKKGEVLGSQKSLLKSLAIAVAKVFESQATGTPPEELPDPRPIPKWAVTQASSILANGGIEAAIERTRLLASGKSSSSTEAKEYNTYAAIANLVGVPTVCKTAKCRTRRTCRSGRRAAPAFCDPLRAKRIQLASQEWGWGGAPTKIAYETDAGIQELPARYALLPLDAVKPSHDPLRNFARTPDYPAVLQERDYRGSEIEQRKVRLAADTNRFKPGLLISSNLDALTGPPVVDSSGFVLGGNGRAMVAKLNVANGGTAYSEYLQRELACNNCYGLSEVDLPGMLLVRILDGTYDTKRISAILNSPMGASLGAEEAAVSLGVQLSSDVLRRLSVAISEEDSFSAAIDHAGPEFVRALQKNGLITPLNQAEWLRMDRGKPVLELNSRAKERLKAAMLGLLIPDVATLRAAPSRFVSTLESIAPIALLIEQTDPENSSGYNFVTTFRENARELVSVVDMDPQSLTERYANVGLRLQADEEGGVDRIMRSAQGVALVPWLRERGDQKLPRYAQMKRLPVLLRAYYEAIPKEFKKGTGERLLFQRQPEDFISAGIDATSLMRKHLNLDSRDVVQSMGGTAAYMRAYLKGINPIGMAAVMERRQEPVRQRQDVRRKSGTESELLDMNPDRMREILTREGDVVVHGNHFFTERNYPDGVTLLVVSLDDADRSTYGKGRGWSRQRAIEEAVNIAFQRQSETTPLGEAKKSIADVVESAKEDASSVQQQTPEEKPKKKKKRKYLDCHKLGKKIWKLEDKKKKINERLDKATSKIPQLKVSIESEKDPEKTQKLKDKLSSLQDKQREDSAAIREVLDSLEELGSKYQKTCAATAEKVGEPVEKIETTVQRQIAAEEREKRQAKKAAQEAKQAEASSVPAEPLPPPTTTPPPQAKAEPTAAPPVQEDPYADPTLWSGGARQARYPRGDYQRKGLEESERQRFDLEAMLSEVEGEGESQRQRHVRQGSQRQDAPPAQVPREVFEAPPPITIERPRVYHDVDYRESGAPTEAPIQRTQVSYSQLAQAMTPEAEEKQRQRFEGKYALDLSDPLLVEKIKRKIEKLEKLQKIMKDSIRICGSEKLTRDKKIERLKQLGMKERLAAKVCDEGFRDEALEENKKNLSHLRRHIGKVKDKLANTTTTTEYDGGVRVVDNVEENKLQVFFQGPPSKKSVNLLGMYSFKLAKKVEGQPWQRKRSDKAKADLEVLLRELDLHKKLLPEPGVGPGILVGGVGDGVPTEAIDPAVLSKGIGVELEHTDDPSIAAQIAIDHIVEKPSYYEKLQAIEGASKGLRRLPEDELTRLIFLLYRDNNRNDSISMRQAITETGIFESQWKAASKSAIADGLASDKKILAKGKRWVKRLYEAGGLPDVKAEASKKNKNLGHWLWMHPFSKGAMGDDEYEKKLAAIGAKMTHLKSPPNLPGFVPEPTIELNLELELARAMKSPCLSSPDQGVESVARQQDPEGYEKIHQRGYRPCWEDDCGRYRSLPKQMRDEFRSDFPRSGKAAERCGYSFYRERPSSAVHARQYATRIESPHQREGDVRSWSSEKIRSRITELRESTTRRDEEELRQLESILARRAMS